MRNLEIKTVDELVTLIQVCVWAVVAIILMLVFGGIVSSFLYSVMFVSQPMKAMSPIDQAFTKMLNDIVLIMASSITTIISMFAVSKASKAAAEKIAPTLGIPPSTPPAPPASPVAPVAPQPSGGMPDFNWMGTAPVQFDEEWRAPPPPTTPPDHLHPEREEIANERAAAAKEEA
jgi:type IV secretory pathway VirB10-like protein